ncbi:MAG: hypothetical protein AAGG51_04080 [Cyanobacteria bacterium P01_G01_bin.54]
MSGSGNDTLTGGSGADVFVLGSGSNTITDFLSGTDKIVIDTSDFGNLYDSDTTAILVISPLAAVPSPTTGHKLPPPMAARLAPMMWSLTIIGWLIRRLRWWCRGRSPPIPVA